jgi:UDP-glucose 4-epimerase
MKVVVFGGSGFLGSNVADELTKRGHEVAIFARTESPYLQAGQQMVCGDILDAVAVANAVAGADYVYNFAGIADLDDATTKPLATAQLNIIGNLNIMEACVAAKVKRFVYASSIYVYSQKGGFYRCSKQASEVYIEEYQRRYNLPFTIVRYGTLYGPRADGRNSVYRYLRDAMEKKELVCRGTGNEMRDYIHVCDAARLSVDILEEKFANQHVILSGHQSIRFMTLLETIKEMLDGEVTIRHIEEKSKDHYAFTPYSYNPKIGFKLVDNIYMDMGQGLLDCLQDMYGEIQLKDNSFNELS